MVQGEVSKGFGRALGCALFIVVAFVVVTVGLILIGSAGRAKRAARQTAEERAETQRPQAEVVPVSVGKWEGTGITNTEAFDVSGEWEIRWACRGEEGMSLLQIFVYKPGQDLLVDLAANAGGTQDGSSRIYQSGRFYLKINAANCSWIVEVVDRG